MASGIPIVVAQNGFGFPVLAVEAGAPLMTVAENGLGAPIVLSDAGVPFVVQGLVPPEPVPIIKNGGFDTDADWTKGTGWSIAGGVAVGVPDVAVADLSQAVALAAGQYLVEFDIVSRTAGSVAARFDGGTPVAGTNKNTVGHHTDTLVSTGNTSFAIRKTSTFNGSIDNVVVTYLGP